MIRLDLIECAEAGCPWLQELKRYASVPDDSQDALLRGLLKRAALVVQEYADRSLLPCRFRLTASGITGGRVRLYQTVSSVDSVRDAEGNDLQYTLSGNVVTLSPGTQCAVIEYSTGPADSEAGILSAVAIRYATALYDGQDNVELSKIVSEVC